MTRYGFDEVKHALDDGWGLTLRRGGEAGFQHDGRWGLVKSIAPLYIAKSELCDG